MNDVLLKYGLAGVVIAGMSWYIIHLDDRHRKERKEEREERTHQFERMSSMSDETNRVMRENTNILSGLKSLLENQNRK